MVVSSYLEEREIVVKWWSKPSGQSGQPSGQPLMYL